MQRIGNAWRSMPSLTVFCVHRVMARAGATSKTDLTVAMERYVTGYLAAHLGEKMLPGMPIRGPPQNKSPRSYHQDGHLED